MSTRPRRCSRSKRGRATRWICRKPIRAGCEMNFVDDVVRIESGHAVLDADLRVPQRAAGLVIFAHGSGSGRFSPRNRAVAGVLERGGFATLLCDLLTKKEESEDQYTREHRFDIPLLGRRVVDAADWAQAQ